MAIANIFGFNRSFDNKKVNSKKIGIILYTLNWNPEIPNDAE